MRARYCGLLLVLLLAGCEKTVPELLEQAKSYRARAENSAAVIAFKNALVQDPRNVEAHLLLGATFADLGEILDAEKELRKALELGAPPERVLLMLGRVLLELEKYQKLLDDVQAAAPLSVQAQSEVALLRGRAHLRLGAVTDARTQFSLAMRERPVEAKLGLAQSAAAEGDGKSADKLMEELLAAAPESADAWVFKGDLLRTEGKTDEALAAYRKAATLQPLNVSAHLSQAVVHISAGSYDAARAEIETARKRSPADPLIQFTRALLALREQKFSECWDALNQVVRQIPQHMPSVLLSGSLFFTTGQLEQAQNAYVAYLSRYPGNAYARKMLAATLLRKEQPQSAAYVIEPLLAHATQDAELLSLAGQAYLQIGQVRKALKYLERAVAIAPDNPRIRTSLGLTRLAGGERQLAVSDLETAVALKPTDTRAENYLIMALIARGETGKALQAAQALEQKQPNKAVTHLLKGAVYLAQQDLAHARASFERSLKLQPGYFPAAAALAQIDLREKNPDAARGRMEAVLKHDKGNLDAMLALAKFEFDAGRRSEAVARLRQAQSDHPQALQAYLMLAQIQLQTGESTDAVAAAQKARDLNPNDPRALEALGKAQLAVGDKGAAIVTLSTLASLLPKSVPAQLLLAGALSANGNHREAMASLKKALLIDPASMDAKSALGGAYLQSKRFREALELALHMQGQKQGAQHGYVLEGDAHMAQQDFARAAAAYRKADAIQSTGLLRMRMHEAESLSPKGMASDAPLLEWVQRHPEDVDTRLYLADVYVKAGRNKAAIEHYQALLRLDPKDFRVLNNMAWALQQEGDPRAIDYAQQAFQLKPNDATIADTLGWALVNQNKLHEGLQVMFKAVSLDPRNPDIRFHLVQALVRAGDNARARSELKIVLDSGKKFSQAEQAQALLRRLSP